ncbi:hypothetical protein BDM02DRAFT_3190859 [Thelephora ganbajun]|uniref:Uncharacterized protein n=1 Tax=Thelephora ganbajun TaxID=370292 RepID=A0ACB6Z3I8_THEGA|nr:hypothetical protein BDM02DRAFT_3190859 [Thelephora ganbajun]
MAEEASMSHQSNRQTRGVAWKPVIENACRDFVDEQLGREPFSSVSLAEGKLYALTNRLDGVERALDADFEKIKLLEERLSVKADGEGQPMEPNITSGKASPPFSQSQAHLGHNPDPIHHSDSSTGSSYERHHVGRSDGVSNLLAGFRSQRLRIRDLVEGRDYGEILDEISKHLESVMLSEPARRKDQTVLSILEKEAEALRRSSHEGSRRVQNNLLGELQQALRNEHAHANATYSARFRLFSKALCSFLAGAHWQVHGLFASLIDAEAQNSLLGRLKQAARGTRTSAAHNTRFLAFFRALRSSLAKGWVGSAHVLGRIYPAWSQAVLACDASRLPVRQWLMVILAPVILALFYSTFSSVGVLPPITTPSRHAASSEPSLPLDVSHCPSVPLVPTAGSVAIPQGEYLEEDFWRSLLEE